MTELQSKSLTQQSTHNQQLTNNQSSTNQPASTQQIQFQFKPQNIYDMNRFDVHQIYSNQQIIAQNKYRSSFIFILPIVTRGKRHLLAIQKTQIIWIILKLIILSLICYYVYQWVDKLENIMPLIKTSLLWAFQILPFGLLLTALIDPGYVLDHEIYQNQYESTDDKKRPKDGKYCEYCKLFVKRKTGHCFKCHHCVSNFDHHCGIMTRCVGRTNAAVFYGFVVLANMIYMGMIVLVFYEWVLV